MKRFLQIYFFLFSLTSNAQQLPQYTQFLFNKPGYNPAASGTSLKYPFEVIFGGRTQWIGLNNNPKSAFLSANYTFIPERAYRNWHNVGMYVDQDRNGIFVDNSIYLSYTFHQYISKNLVMSAGLFAGMKQFSINSSQLNIADPAVANNSRALFAYPDIIPGIRLYNKKFFIDFSLWQVSVFSQRNYFSRKQIGSPSKLPLHYIFSAGRKVSLPWQNMLLVSLNVRGNYKSIPNLELNFMNYWHQRFAYGFSVRHTNFICGIFQVRIINNLVVGFAYDLSINRFIRAASHTGEIMIGITPMFGNNAEGKKQSRAIDDCYF